MDYFIGVLVLAFLLGVSSVASNPSPFFAALGLVVVAATGCVLLVLLGGNFLSLILFLIYLGGMLVVFGYSAALAAEPYPETFTSWPIFVGMVVYLGGAVVAGVVYVEGWSTKFMSWINVDSELTSGWGDMEGVALTFSSGGPMLLVAVWVLLLTLLVVLELTRGLTRGTLRSV